MSEPLRIGVLGAARINELAILEPARITGARLVAMAARDRARALGLGELSLLVFADNDGAVRLYERAGFKEVGRQPSVPHPLIRRTGDVLLMTAPV